MSPFQKRRSAFSMITAIFVILILASIGAFIMNISGKVVQETGAQYRKEQAILYAKSYTEYAIMAAISQTCVNNITANLDGSAQEVKQGQGYFVDVRIHYIGASTCANNIDDTIIQDVRAIDNIILVDTYVRYRDPNSIAAKSLPPLAWESDSGMTYYRRTIQRL